MDQKGTISYTMILDTEKHDFKIVQFYDVTLPKVPSSHKITVTNSINSYPMQSTPQTKL